MNRHACLLIVASLLAVHFATADVLTTSTGVRTGQVMRVDATTIVFKMDVGEIGIPRAEVSDVQVDQPPTFERGVNALGNRDYPAAIAALKPVVDRLAGLEIDWIQDALLKLGDAQVGAQNYAEAKATFDRFRSLYAESPKATGLDAKFARILVAQQRHDAANAVLTKLITPLLAKKAITPEEELAAAEALVLLGDCQQVGAKLDDALDSYLNVVTLFNVSPELTAEARYKAAQIFEEKKNWRRAKSTYKLLSENAPQPDIVADAKKRLTALNEAHPE